MQGDEWEEKWGEHYLSKGKAKKWADKWGKEGGNIWHERWGEDYPESDSCVKYTDKVSLNSSVGAFLISLATVTSYRYNII